ncbi:Gaa1 protein [Rhizoctonia solani]|uniref:Gaa1 protein n=1 Tax=Rhizoctonia solani TaxID=456999 RepID=A0A8H7IGU6_9AGAM|nr:Gaa1 protein [Rhizoctonia solani]
MQLSNSETFVNDEGAGRAKAIVRRRVIFAVIGRVLPWLRAALFLTGTIWMCCIPLPQMGRGTYIDENALQPGQVNTYWSWREVHAADRYLEDLEKLRDANATSQQRATYFRDEFAKLGLPTEVQPYTIHAPTGGTEGVNVYSIYTAPRSSGSEAIVLSASWKSLKWDEDGSLNLRGVATILALASYLKREISSLTAGNLTNRYTGYTLWAKDIVFVISDGYMDGSPDLETQPLTLLSGVVWTALCIDYPGHSFSHLGVYFEGLNGRLPNQDLLNSVLNIARYSNGVSVLAYDALDHLRTDHPYDFGPRTAALWNYLPKVARKMLNDPNMKTFENRAGIVSRSIAWQASGRASGVHGLFHQCNYDIRAPLSWPHGFFVLGKIIESTTRTMNNLLERLHASFFFYILTSAQSFIKIGGYLPAAVIMSVAMTFGGLALWVEASWVQIQIVITDADKNSESSGDDHIEHSKKWVKRSRPVVDAFVLAGCTHCRVAPCCLLWAPKLAWMHLLYGSSHSLGHCTNPAFEWIVFRKGRASLNGSEILYSLPRGNNNGITIPA